MFTYKASNILAVRKLEYTACYVLPRYWVFFCNTRLKFLLKLGFSVQCETYFLYKLINWLKATTVLLRKFCFTETRSLMRWPRNPWVQMTKQNTTYTRARLFWEGGGCCWWRNLTSCLTAKKEAVTIIIKVWYPFWSLGMFSLQWHCISVAMKTYNVCSIPRLIKLDDTTTTLLHNDISNN